jgi:uncharacterized membrane protein
MKPLYVLLGAFITSLIILRFGFGELDYSLSGRIAMSVMLMFTAIGHFAFSKGMILMIPDFIPFKKTLVYFTGIVEMAASIGLLIHTLQHITAILLIIFFILILPANINAAIKHIDFQKATNEGSGTNYLWFRIPLQVFFIAWTYFFAIYLLAV